MTTAAIVVILFLLWLLPAIVRVLNEYERGVIFRLGRFAGVKGPGLVILVPIVDKMMKVDMRVVTLDVPPQEVVTKDNVPIKVNAVAYFRVVDPEKAIIQVRNYSLATSQIAQTTLRSILGEYELDEILSQREMINQRLQEIIDAQTDPWGIKVSTVELKDVELSPELLRAIAKQAEAERERRAKIISAEGELQAAEKLATAGEIISKSPSALTLRFFHTLNEISSENATTVVIPLPMDLFKIFAREG
jgi:regulator of protease activity HflC (stomatin/prohibitin superfamily)